MNNPSIQPLSIRALLEGKSCYVIPMYQRNYAWREQEINQLIFDIEEYRNVADENKKRTYHIGTLVVLKRQNKDFEVIDGQQRLTTLSLIANWLKNNESSSIDMTWYRKITVFFDNRSTSDCTFQQLWNAKSLHNICTDNANEGLLRGYEEVGKALEKLKLTGTNLADFCHYLFKYVCISRVEVPEDTDLSHFFEAMNNRGEQLEKHEIIKARLMEKLNHISDKKIKEKYISTLSTVWNACADMERYVQYGFSPEQRDSLFGAKNWSQFKPTHFDHLVDLIFSNDSAPYAEQDYFEKQSLSSILSDSSEEGPHSNSVKSDTISERFGSIVNFPNFLLHVLRTMDRTLKNDHKKDEIEVHLDDKQLITQFENHILKQADAITAVQNFTYSLLKCRYLLDQFVIKRETTNGEEHWSLKKLHYRPNKKVSYQNSFDDDKKHTPSINKRVLMLLSAFHVSTPTQTYKYWLSGALHYLFNSHTPDNAIDQASYLFYLERIARHFVFDRFLSLNNKKASYSHIIYNHSTIHRAVPVKRIWRNEVASKLRFGQIENNFIFNFLDYLIWLKRYHEGALIQNFEFTFRSSVEHFSPQHPMDGYEPLPPDALHCFGNLCLISHSKNARLSNYQPQQKREHFETSLKSNKIDSLKLWEMLTLMKKRKHWKKREIAEHCLNMIDILAAEAHK